MHTVSARMILTTLALLVGWVTVDLANASLKIRIAKLKVTIAQQLRMASQGIQGRREEPGPRR